MIKEAYIGWSRGEVFISKVIETFDGYFSHVYYKFVFDNGLELVYESYWNGGVQITPYSHVLEAQERGDISTICEYKLEDCIPDELWKECLKLHGDKYDKAKLALYFIWMRIFRGRNKKIVTRRNGEYTCNEFCIEAGRKAVRRMKNLDFSKTPNLLFKFFYGRDAKEIYGNN